MTTNDGFGSTDLVRFPRSRFFAVTSSVAVILIFLAIGLTRLDPWVDDVGSWNMEGDDWKNYRENAMSIVEGGLGMPSVPGPYYMPGAFLYNYVVAASFALFGPSTGWVYLLQYGFLGAGATLMFALARPRMEASLAFALLIATSWFHYEAFEYWVGRLLSEDVVVVAYPAALALAAVALSRRSLWRMAAAGAVAGTVVLLRQHMLLFPLLISVCLVLYQRNRRGVMNAGIFLVGVMAVMALQPFRNWAVSGQLFASGYPSLLPSGDLSAVMTQFMRKGLFCVGVLVGGWDLNGSEIVVHKRWLLLHLFAAGATGFLLWRRRFTIVDAFCIATIVSAYVPFIAMRPLGGYGLRFQTPYGAALIFVTFRAADLLIADLRATWLRTRQASIPAAPASGE